MAEVKKRYRIKQGHGIGGIGYAGQEVALTREEAEMYAEYIEAVPPSPALPPNGESANSGEGSKVVKPQSKRRSARKAKK